MMCESGKLGYASKPDALAAVKRIRKRRRISGPLETYQCAACRGWHLTSNPDASKRQPSKEK